MDELAYTLKESDLKKLQEYIEFQAYKEIERAFNLGKSKLTNEEEAIITNYKAHQIAVNVINAIERGDY